jgi:hypothetical protein
MALAPAMPAPVVSGPVAVAQGPTATARKSEPMGEPVADDEDEPVTDERRPIATPPPPAANGDGDEEELVDPQAHVVVPLAHEEPEAEQALEDAYDENDEAAGLPLIGVDERWIQLVDRVARKARPLAMHLDHGSVVAIRDGEKIVIEVCFPRELHERAIAGAVDDPSIVEAAGVFGKGARLVVVKRPAERTAPTISEARDRAIADAQAALEAHARAHPVVEKAVALFGGEVRHVKRTGRPKATP